MDEHFERLCRIYPDSKFALIPKYVPEVFKDKPYDSAFDTKAAINKWKNHPLTITEARQKLEEGYRLGWIVPKGYVIVDVDNKDDARSQEYLERLLEKFEVKYNYNYTSRGVHYLFRDETETIKTDSVIKCGLNITIDTRANETGYIVLPSNDPHRSWGDWNDFVEDIPYFLKPLLKDSTPSFIGMVDGDGRNDAMLKWRTRLEQSHKLSEKEVEKCIRIINENIFDTPMTNEELYKTVLRERDKKDKVNPAERENAYNLMAEELLGKIDIICYGDYIYKFNGIYYKPIEKIELEKLIHFELSKNINDTGRSEIVKFIKLKTQVKLEDLDKDWYKIACKSGILNLVTGEVTQPTKADYNTIYIPFAYNEDPVYSPRIDNFMKELTEGDPIKMQFLYQIAGYCLLKKNLFEKFFIFKGEGGTGKSTYVNLIHRMVGGDTNCAHIGLAEFDKDYYLSTLLSKLVNIDDDVVDGKMLANTGRFKSIISGNIISVRQIYKEVISFVPYVTCIFNCNKLPKIMDRTTGLYRRLILLELNHKILKPDPLFMNKITDDDMEYFLYKAVEGVKQALEEGHFRINKSEEELLNIFKRGQSPINEWLYENSISLGDLHNHKCMALYNMFTQWCSNNGYNKVMSMFSFKDEICSLYDIDTRFATDDDSSRTPVQIFFKKGEFDKNFMPF